MKENQSAQFQKAISLRNAGEFDESLKILYNLIKELPDNVKYYIIVGANLGDLGRTESAIPYHLTAVRMEPADPIASLGLVHALWNLRRDEEALSEAVRFDHLNATTEYAEILTNHLRGKFQGLKISKEIALLVSEQVARYPKGYQPPYEDDFKASGKQNK